MVVKCLFRQVLEGVEYLHKNDIIHRSGVPCAALTFRDLKISNLLLNARGILKIGILPYPPELANESRLWHGQRNNFKTNDSPSRNGLVTLPCHAFL
jgi:hypothetical protein